MLRVKDRAKPKLPPVEPGVYISVCVGVIDLGEQLCEYKEKKSGHGRFAVWDADNRVLDGIRLTASLLQAGRLNIHRDCTDCIAEFRSYRWDTKAGEDTVIKENDHAMDDIRYFSATIMEREVRGAGI